MKKAPRRNKLEPRQMAAIVRSVLDGQILQREIPEIAESYKQGKTLNDIVQEYQIISRFGIPSLDCARNTIRYALRGYDGGEDIYSEQLEGIVYSGLIDPTELERFGKEHISVGSSKWSKEYYAQRRGLFAITKEQRVINASKAGKRVRELGKGIHCMSSHEKRLAALKGNAIRGFTNYSDEEDKVIYELSSNPEMSYGTKGHVNCHKLATIINNRFYLGEKVRNNLSISRRIRTLKKNYRNHL